MKRYGQLLICILLVLGTASTSYAQLSKKEAKKEAKRAKKEAKKEAKEAKKGKKKKGSKKGDKDETETETEAKKGKNKGSKKASKKEIKEWKKKAKSYVKNPEDLKNLVEESQSLSAQVSKQEADNNNLQSRISDKDAKITGLEDDLTKLRSDLGTAKKEVRDMKAAAAAEPVQRRGPAMKGIVFKVQIGAFRNKDLSKYFENHENFSGETDQDGTQKITLGQFADYWEADTFKKYLREMGVNDAWIVPYKDGERKDIKEVLEVIGKESAGG